MKGDPAEVIEASLAYRLHDDRPARNVRGEPLNGLVLAGAAAFQEGEPVQGRPVVQTVGAVHGGGHRIDQPGQEEQSSPLDDQAALEKRIDPDFLHCPSGEHATCGESKNDRTLIEPKVLGGDTKARNQDERTGRDEGAGQDCPDSLRSQRPERPRHGALPVCR